MSVNTVARHEGLTPFCLQQGEIIRFQSLTTRQPLAITLQDPKSINVHINVNNGSIYVTNRRFLYITDSLGDVSSFVIEFSQAQALRFSHLLESPWFGPNYWKFRFFSPSSGICNGFPKEEWFDGKVIFKDGGVTDFISIVDTVLNDSVNNSHIDEELPRYSAY